MKTGYKASYMELNYKMFFEPKEGINSPKEFTDELLRWAEHEKKHMVIIEESMEPKIELDDGKTYICKLGDPHITTQNNPIWKALGFKGVNPSIGRYLGYKWVFLYEIE